MTRLQLTHIMHGMLAAMLIGNAVLVRTRPAYQILTRAIAASTRDVEAEAALQDSHRRMMRSKEDTERVAPYYAQMLKLHIRALQTSLFLDSIKGLITAVVNGAGSNRVFPLHQKENNKWKRQTGWNEAAVSALLGRLDSLREAQLERIRFEYIAQEMRKTHPLNWCEEMYAAGEAPCRYDLLQTLLKANAAEAVALITSLQVKVHRSDDEVLRELNRETRGTDEGGLHLVTIAAIPLVTAVVPGQTIMASIFEMAYYPYPYEAYSCNKGRIMKVERGILTWRGKATYPGLQRINGSATIKLDTALSRRAWAFSFRAIAPFATIEIARRNIIYRGIENPVTIQAASCYEPSRLLLFAQGASIEQMNENHYNIRVKSPRAKALTVFIVYNGSNGSDTIGSMVTQVANAPIPIARVEDLSSDRVTVTALLRASSLRLYNPDTSLENSFLLQSYTMTRIPHNGADSAISIRNIRSTVGSFDTYTDISELIRGAAHGDRIMFEDILAIDPGGRAINVAPVCYTIQ